MKRPKILVLGAGLVGAEIARCLSEEGNVTVVDRSEETLADLPGENRHVGSLHSVRADFFDTNRIRKLARCNDVVVGAIEPSIAYRVLTQVIEAGTPIVDISFYEESPLSLDPIAKRAQIPIVVDCGVAPGLSNMLLGRETKNMRVHSFVCQCAGLPEEPQPPQYYKAPFSARSVIDLYTRKAAAILAGKEVMLDPLETLEEVRLDEYPELGTLVGFTSDGLRTLLETPGILHMADQTLRYPQHMRLMYDLIKSGLLSEEPVSVKDCYGNVVEVTPRALNEKVLAQQWRLKDNEKEFTIFIVTIEGVMEDGTRKRVVYRTLERRDPVTGATSMSRMTGYPCAAVALLLAQGKIVKHGVVTPEVLGMRGDYMKFILDFMSERGISLTRTEVIL